MKIETREDALLVCFDFWLNNAVTGTSCKWKWRGWTAMGGDVEYCDHHCPCCEFIGSDGRACGCRDCPIKWGHGKVTRSYRCVRSECGKWANAKNHKERSKWALAIAVLALEALCPAPE